MGQTKMTQLKKAHQIVIELTSSDPQEWEKLVNNAENLIRALGESATMVEIVSHGDGLQILLKSTANRPEERMQKLSKIGVVFAACENTMRRMDITPGDLVPYAEPIDSGVAEVVRKCEEGWSYISR